MPKTKKSTKRRKVSTKAHTEGVKKVAVGAEHKKDTSSCYCKGHRCAGSKITGLGNKISTRAMDKLKKLGNLFTTRNNKR